MMPPVMLRTWKENDIHLANHYNLHTFSEGQTICPFIET